MFNKFNSMLGSDVSVTDYPGKIPKGVDLPSDAVVEDNNIKKGE